MKLPNAEHAIIDPRKLTEYSLNPYHDDGKHKALLFRNLLGIAADNPRPLVEALRNAAVTEEAQPGQTNRYGRRYLIDFDCSGMKGPVRIRSAWIVRTGEVVPRLVTCYII
jgi:hypothetical protein